MLSVDLNECKRRRFVKESSPDEEKSISLLDMAFEKEHLLSQLEITNESVSTIFTLQYDALRMTLDSFCLLKGFVVLNHVCLGELTNLLLPNFDLTLFNGSRFARNSVNYYGKHVSLDRGKELITQMKSLRLFVEKETRKII